MNGVALWRRPLNSIKRSAYVVLTVLSINLSLLAVAQVGWAVSETVQVPRTDFSVTGPPPYECLDRLETEKLSDDPVHTFQVWASLWLETNWDWTGRLQTYDNCAEVCAAVPLEAQAIVELRGFVRELPNHSFSRGVWPSGGSYSIWEQEVDSSRVRGNKRLVCATVHNWHHNGDLEGYFVVYFSY